MVRAQSGMSLSLEGAAGGSQTSLLRQSTHNAFRKRAAKEMLGLPRSGYSRSAEAVGEISPPTQQRTRKEGSRVDHLHWAQPSFVSCSDRYDPTVWGMVRRTRGGRGMKAETLCVYGEPLGTFIGVANTVHKKWDLAKCRELLVQMEVDDLRSRLQNSSWRQGKALNHINWLKEAAAAFGVPLKMSQAQGASGAYRAKISIVNDVLKKIADAQTITPGSALERDAHRRQLRHDQLRQRCQVLAARKFIVTNPVNTGVTIEVLREEVLVYECPDKLRRQVVSEYISMHGVLPEEDATGLGERRAYLYHQSALDRLHLSTSTGPQLTYNDCLAWEAVWALLPAELMPCWPDDPVFLRARAYYASHGHLDVQKQSWRRRKLLTEEKRAEDRLARELDVVREAKQHDVFDHTRRAYTEVSAGATLMRRKLTVQAIAAWENAFGRVWAWLPRT